MGGYHPKKKPSNGNLRWRSIVTKDTNDPKGWPHPEGRQRRRNRVEGSPHNQAREEEPRLKDQHRPWRRSDSRADQRKLKSTASAWGSGTARRPKANPTKVGESNVTIVDWGRTQTVPETGDLTCRLRTPQNPGGQRHSSSTMASQQLPDKEPG